MADATQLRQVVMNLVINGAHAMTKGGGKVVVVTKLLDVPVEEFSWGGDTEQLAQESYVSLEVIDAGDGMTEEVKNRMFEPFFTTKVDGRGLGLAALLGIIKTHNGVIRVSSAPGEGTEVLVVLPTDEPK